ncbi:MAG: calcium/proton exchanger [Chloroflexota bacterium]
MQERECLELNSPKPRRWWLSSHPLYVFVPISIVLSLLHFDPLWVFVSAILAILPVTSLIARTTEEIAQRIGTAAGSLFSVTFGNAIELLIAILAIREGLVEMVKAALVGSIVLNILSIVGLSIFFGGLKYREQHFNQGSVGVASTMLLIAVTGLVLPTIYSVLTGRETVLMSYAVAITLGITYVLSLVFVLVTHKHLFKAVRDACEVYTWGMKKAALGLTLGVVLAAIESDILVSVLRPMLALTGLHEAFVGLVVIAILTNIPEHLAAIRYALRDNVTLSLEIGMNSATQIALFVAPVLVFVSPLVGGTLTLSFAPFQMIALILAVMIINYLGSDGVCNWLEGVQLVAVYLIIAIAFFFV